MHNVPPVNEPEIPADIETASKAYAARFAGPAGRWMLDVQARHVLGLLKPVTPVTVLEVGGGHGQLTGGLIQAGYQVTVQGSTADCRRGVDAWTSAGKCAFVQGSYLNLPFPDQSFDAVVSVRLIMHSAAWPQVIAEMCRVARRAVIVDYPRAGGLNRLAPWLFGAKKKLEKNTRTWRNFTHAEVAEAFARHGLRAAARSGQFVFPMVLHRTVQARAISAFLEGVTAAVGLNRRLGTPVLARFDRRPA